MASAKRDSADRPNRRRPFLQYSHPRCGASPVQTLGAPLRAYNGPSNGFDHFWIKNLSSGILCIRCSRRRVWASGRTLPAVQLVLRAAPRSQRNQSERCKFWYPFMLNTADKNISAEVIPAQNAPSVSRILGTLCITCQRLSPAERCSAAVVHSTRCPVQHRSDTAVFKEQTVLFPEMPAIPLSDMCVLTVTSSKVFQTFSTCQSHWNCQVTLAECTVRDVSSMTLAWVCFFRHSPGGGETGSPHPKSCGFLVMLGGYLGGGGIAPQALLLATTVATSEEEGLHLTALPRNIGRYFRGGGTGPPPHNSNVYSVCFGITARK